MNQENSNKRIAKNTIYLYIRMIFTIFVSLYTGRIILNVLGVEDYGIYNVVGGVVASFSFLTNTLSGASSRFITYELEKATPYRLRLVFNTSLNMHILLACVIFILAESLGLWLLNSKLVIPAERMIAAQFVYQCCIISTIISITQIPYNANIIAHEKMNVYAYISILEVSLKLISVFILQYFNTTDKLILYGILTVLVSLLITTTYRVYCIKKFSETKYLLRIDKSLFKAMLTFSGWDLYGNMSVVVSSQGKVMLLNTFFGPIINASSGIASQVSGIITNFVTNFQMAVRPQIVKRYAENNLQGMISLCNNSAKYSFILLLLISLPVILETNYILYLWLGKVPQYLVPFVQLCLIMSIIWGTFQPISICIHAIGKMKKISFLTGTLYIISILIMYIFLYFDYNPNIVFIIDIFIAIVAGFINLLILKSYIPEYSVSQFYKNVMVKIVTVGILSIPIPCIIPLIMEENILRLLITCCISSICISIISYQTAVSKDVKIKVKNKIKIIVKHQQNK